MSDSIILTKNGKSYRLSRNMTVCEIIDKFLRNDGEVVTIRHSIYDPEHYDYPLPHGCNCPNCTGNKPKNSSWDGMTTPFSN